VAKSLPGLIIKIGANTKDAIDGLNKVNRAVGQSATGAQRLQASWRKAAPALGMAAAAAGALAVAMGTQAVRAALEEEVAVSKLSKTLENLGLAAADTRVEAFIDDMQFATGIADNDLRPAMDRLVRSTQNVGEAQTALGLAADIAVSKNRSVVDVANILGKAYDGNTMALGRLGVGLDKTILKSGDMGAITAELSKLFEGQAARAADTLQGRMNILRIGVDELNESLGKGIIDGFMQSMGAGSGDVEAMSDQLRDMQQTAHDLGETVGTFIAGALKGFGILKQVVTAMVVQVYDLFEGYQRLEINVSDFFGEITDEQAEAARKALDLSYAQRHAAAAADILGYSNDKAADAIDEQTAATTRSITAGESDARTMDKRKSAADKLKASLDKLNDNRSIMRQRINLRRMLEEGPQGTGKDGRVTGRDRRLFALDVADARAQLGEDIFDRGGKGSKGDARQQFSLGRKNLRDLGFGAGFINNVLSTPDALKPGSGPRPGTPQTGSQVANVNYVFTGDIRVESDAALRQAAKEAKRLAALSGSRYAGMAETGKGY
jgi:hypothetical protein